MSLSEARFHDLVDATQQAVEDIFDEGLHDFLTRFIRQAAGLMYSTWPSRSRPRRRRGRS